MRHKAEPLTADLTLLGEAHVPCEFVGSFSNSCCNKGVSTYVETEQQDHLAT